MQALELPAGNGVTTARSLARVYALLAQGGELDDVRLLSKETVDAFATKVQDLPDHLLSDVRLPGAKKLLAADLWGRSTGYLMNPKAKGKPARFGPNPASYGHDGAGGQLGFCDPDNHIAVGYVRNHLSRNLHIGAPLVEALYACVGGSLA
jgi:CubicO group peptidase (beta-lactamase class C family)